MYALKKLYNMCLWGKKEKQSKYSSMGQWMNQLGCSGKWGTILNKWATAVGTSTDESQNDNGE